MTKLRQPAPMCLGMAVIWIMAVAPAGAKNILYHYLKITELYR